MVELIRDAVDAVKEPLRSLAPTVAAALVFAAVLIAWIAIRPTAMPRDIQIVMTLAIVLGQGILLWLVLKAEQNEPPH